MLILTVTTLLGCVGPRDAGETSTGSPSTGRSGTADSSRAEVPPAAWQAVRESATRRMLVAQARAVLGGDLDAALSSVAPGAERSVQRTRVERMRTIGLSALSLASLTEVTPPAPIAAAATVTWDVEASFDYQIKGFDRSPRRFALALTLSGGPSRPGQVLVTESRPAERPQPWDLDDLEVRRSEHALVLAAGSGIDVDEVRRRADRTAAEVAAVWGDVVPAVWVAPGTVADAERLLGRSSGDLTGLAAATDGPLEPGTPAGADRIVLNPDAWASLQPQGRDVVMAHELTHVTVRASTTRAVPLWLSEGFAEYVAYRSIAVPERTVVGPYVKTLRDQGPPRHLPGAEQFAPGAGSLPAAYAQSWQAVLALVESHGRAGVVRLYRAAAGGLAVQPAVLGDPEAVVDVALRETLGTSRQRVEQTWRERLAALTRD